MWYIVYVARCDSWQDSEGGEIMHGTPKTGKSSPTPNQPCSNSFVFINQRLETLQSVLFVTKSKQLFLYYCVIVFYLVIYGDHNEQSEFLISIKYPQESDTITFFGIFGCRYCRPHKLHKNRMLNVLQYHCHKLQKRWIYYVTEFAFNTFLWANHCLSLIHI